jgi:hypothetical protein
VTSLKQHEYEEDSDWVKDLEIQLFAQRARVGLIERIRGILGFSASAEWKPLRRELGTLHVLVTVCVNEGQQKRPDKSEFRYVEDQSVPPVFNSNDLRLVAPRVQNSSGISSWRISRDC